MSVYKYGDVEFWAENGFVYIINTKLAESVSSYTKATEEERMRLLKGLPPQEFLKRAIAVGLIESGRWNDYPSELKKIKKFLQEARETYKKAMEQAKSRTENHKKQVKIFLPNEINFSPKTIKPDEAEKILLDGIQYQN